MKNRTHRRWMALLLPALIGVGCNEPVTESQILLARMDESKASPRPYLTAMVDNAMMHDVSVADFHFVPHSPELSGSGVARLDRMAVVLDSYGGTVRYETYQTDEAFIGQRLERVRDYLSLLGCDMDRIEVKAMMSGGRGFTGKEAAKVEEQGTAPKEQQEQAPLLLNLGSGGR